MLRSILNNVKETTTTSNIGDITLLGAVSGYNSFASQILDNGTFYYWIQHQTLSEYEFGLGSLLNDTLFRTKVIESSNANTLVNFSAGTKDVFMTSFDLPYDSQSSGDTLVSEGALINSATSKATPVDADMLGLMDSAASNILKKLSWLNLKATLKTYFDTLYQSILVSGSNIRTVNGSTLLGSTNLLAGSAICGIVSITQSATTTSYFVMNYILSGVAFASRAGRQIPFSAGTFKNFFLRLNTGQPASGSLVVSLYNNAAVTAISITIPAGSASGVYSDTSNSASVVNGDLVCYEVINNASGSSGTIQTISINYYAS